MEDEERERLDHSRVEAAVREVEAAMRKIEERGQPAKNPPELAKADTSCFGIAVHMQDGTVIEGGDSQIPFSLQSVSKVFALTLALQHFGDDVWRRVGREPSGDPFNSIIDLERMKGIPRNPFINSGAIVVADLLLARGKDAETVEAQMRRLAKDDSITVDEAVMHSELERSHSNIALANLACSFGNIQHPVDEVMRAYIHQCSIALTCRQLAAAGRFLTEGHKGGKTMSTDDARRIRRINALMITCGQYDGSGEFAFRVGLPAKSGVGGAILAIVPNIASVAVWSPGLDESGNSHVGTLALEMLSETLGWSVFADQV